MVKCVDLLIKVDFFEDLSHKSDVSRQLCNDTLLEVVRHFKAKL